MYLVWALQGLKQFGSGPGPETIFGAAKAATDDSSKPATATALTRAARVMRSSWGSADACVPLMNSDDRCPRRPNHRSSVQLTAAFRGASEWKTLARTF